MSTHQPGLDDAQLVERARQHDQQAFGEIYDRYSDDIFTFCRSRLRNDADAADAMQETFVRAATRLDQLSEPGKLRSWLFAIARNQIIATGREAARAIGGDGMAEVIDLRPDPDTDLLRAESSAELWDAAAGLSDRDQEVLELHVRHGLVGQALADAMGVSESHANVMVSRMKDRIATSLGGLLVARSGREDCDELDQLLAGWDGRFTLDMRSRVTRHIRSCEICEHTQRTVLAAGAFALPLSAAPPSLRGATIGRMVDASKHATLAPKGPDGGSAAGSAGGASAGSAWEWRPDGFPGVPEAAHTAAVVATARRSPAPLLFAAAAVVFALLGAGAWLLFGGGSATTVDVAGAVEVNPSTTATPDPSTTVAAAAAQQAGTTTTDGTTTTATAASSTTEAAALAPAETDPPADQADEEPEVAAPPTPAPETTVAPTTAAPTTAAPTTQTPTTEAPTTPAPATEPPPTSEDPPPSTEAPPPSTDAPPPSTEPPPPSTEPPPPSSDAPQPPPSTDPPPATPPPTTEEPPPPNRAPFIRSVSTDPFAVTVRAGACNGARTTVTVEVVDDGELISVVATWEPEPGRSASQALTSRNGTTFRGTAGTWSETGPQVVTIVVTDDRGETATSQGSVRVIDCGIGGFTG